LPPALGGLEPNASTTTTTNHVAATNRSEPRVAAVEGTSISNINMTPVYSGRDGHHGGASPEQAAGQTKQITSFDDDATPSNKTDKTNKTDTGGLLSAPSTMSTPTTMTIFSVPGRLAGQSVTSIGGNVPEQIVLAQGEGSNTMLLGGGGDDDDDNDEKDAPSARNNNNNNTRVAETETTADEDETSSMSNNDNNTSAV